MEILTLRVSDELKGQAEEAWGRRNEEAPVALVEGGGALWSTVRLSAMRVRLARLC